MRFMIAAVLVAMACAANAGTIITSQCERYSDCTTTIMRVPPRESKVIVVPRQEYDERAWLEFCQPRTEVGTLGVEFYIYKHAGCEYGMTK